MTPTNATKANIVAAVNAVLALLVGLEVMSAQTSGYVIGIVNAVAVLVIGFLPGPLNYKSSPKRVA